MMRYAEEFGIAEYQSALSDARAASQASDWARAAILWDALLAGAPPDDPQCWIDAADAHCAIGNVDRAERILAEALNRFPSNPRIGYHSAKLAADAGKWDEALDHAEAVRASTPSFWHSWLLTAQALRELGREKEAQARWIEAGDRFPNEFWPSYWSAKARSKSVSPADAIDVWGDVVKRFPDRPAATSELRMVASANQSSAAGPGEGEWLHKLVAAQIDGQQIAVAFSARFAAIPFDRVIVRFLDGVIEYVVPTNFPDADRRRSLTNRWLSTRPLFAKVAELYPSLRGVCELWITDRPRGPGLVFSGNAASQVCIPDSLFLSTGGYAQLRSEIARRDKPWSSRKKTVFWRGASSGHRTGKWQDLPRAALCLKAAEANRHDLLDVALSNIVQVDDPQISEEMNQAGIVKDRCSPTEFLDYRYAIDIDGNSCSWPGLITKLMMENTVLKVDSREGFRQWYYDLLVPWQNFVPVSSSMSELRDLAVWLSEHDEVAGLIAERGRALSEALSYDKVLIDSAHVIRDHIAASKFLPVHELCKDAGIGDVSA